MKEEVSISPRFILSIQTWFRLNDYIAQSSNTCKGLEEAIMARYDSPVQLFAVEEVEGVAREGGTTKTDADVISRRKTKSGTSGVGEFQIREEERWISRWGSEPSTCILAGATNKSGKIRRLGGKFVAKRGEATFVDG